MKKLSSTKISFLFMVFLGQGIFLQQTWGAETIAETPSSWIKHSFSLQGERQGTENKTKGEYLFEIQLPKEYKKFPVQTPSSAAPVAIQFYIPDTRTSPFLELKISHDISGHQGEKAEAFPKTQKLQKNYTLHYKVSEPVAGGSGGQEQELQGKIDFGNIALTVTCRDQSEPPSSPHPQWCLPYLHHLLLKK